MANLFLIRHAEPVGHYTYDGPDSERPLSKLGEAQARWMGEFLRDKEIKAIHTATHERCRRTAELIGEALGLTPKPRDDLHISRAFDVAPVLSNEIWVAHSNNIPGALRKAGVPCWQCGHASAWRVELDKDGTISASEYIEPEVA